MRVLVLIAALVIVGCTPLSQQQKTEYDMMRDDGVLVEEKSTGTAVGLGFLPGGGAFYTRSPGIGVLDLLLWPISILWDPVVGFENAKKINYEATLAKLDRKQRRELRELEDEHDLKKISDEEYVIKRREIHDRYDYKTKN